MLFVPVSALGAAAGSTVAVQRGLDGLVASSGGPPGAIVTLYRDGRLTVLRAGRADVRRRGAPRVSDHMRLGSVTKAFSGAVALRLVQQGKLALDDTIAERAAGLPAAWGGVTLRQLLNHTSGLPNFTTSQGFVDDTGAGEEAGGRGRGVEPGRGVGLGRGVLPARRAHRVRPRRSRSAVLRRGAAAPAAAVRARRRVQPAGSGQEWRRAGDLPLPDALR